jgi:hypothetical protein
LTAALLRGPQQVSGGVAVEFKEPTQEVRLDTQGGKPLVLWPLADVAIKAEIATRRARLLGSNAIGMDRSIDQGRDCVDGVGNWFVLFEGGSRSKTRLDSTEKLERLPFETR